MTRKVWTLVAALGVALAAFGCDDTWRGFKKDAHENSETAKRKAEEANLDEAAAKAAAKAKEAAEAAKRGIEGVARDLSDGDQPTTAEKAPAPAPAHNDAERAVNKAQTRLEEAGRELADEARAAGRHIDVKQALGREKALDASHINVDVDDDSRTIFLRGSVPSLGQKVAAERVALAHARDYKVRNDLVIASDVR